MADVLRTLRQLLDEAVLSMAEEKNVAIDDIPEFAIEKPKNEGHGEGNKRGHAAGENIP